MCKIIKNQRKLVAFGMKGGINFLEFFVKNRKQVIKTFRKKATGCPIFKKIVNFHSLCFFQPTFLKLP